MSEDEAPETTRVKASLARLGGMDDADVIERAAAAIEDVAAAAAFVEAVGLDRLEVAVDAVEDPSLRSNGRIALDEFRRFRTAVSGTDEATAREGSRPGSPTAAVDQRPDDPDNGEEDRTAVSIDAGTDQFHRGRGTTLNDDAERSAE